MLNKLTGIEDALFDDGGSAIFYTSSNTSAQLNNLNASVSGWVHDWAASSMDFNTNSGGDIYTIKAYSMLLGDIHDSIIQVPNQLNQLMTAFQPVTNVNVQVALDGTTIAASVTTQIERDLQLIGA